MASDNALKSATGRTPLRCRRTPRLPASTHMRWDNDMTRVSGASKKNLREIRHLTSIKSLLHLTEFQVCRNNNVSAVSSSD
jgi:hypothetical protein